MSLTTSTSVTPLGHILSAVRRHKTIAGGGFLLVAALVSLAVLLWPKSYRSEGKFFVRLGRENATLDPTASVGQEPFVGVSYSYENEINSVVEVLTSRQLLERVVAEVGPSAILGYGDSSLVAWSQFDQAPAADGNEIRDRALRWLINTVKVTAVRKSNIVQVSCQGQSPEVAQKILTKLIELYLDEHIRLNRPPQTHEFFVKQTERLRVELTKKEETLRDLKTSTGLASPSQQRQVLVSRMARLQDDVAEAETAEAALRSRVQAIRKQIAGMPETRLVSHTDGIADEGTNRMREQLYALQIKKEEAAAKYSSEHPAMQRIEQQLAAAQEILGRQASSRPQATTAINHSYEETQLALLREEPLLAATHAQADMRRSQLAEVTRQWKQFNESELSIAQLDRDVELLQGSYHKSAKALDQARLDHALQLQRMSNISIVQSASLERRPVSPPLKASLAFALAMGVLGSLGLPLLKDGLGQDVGYRVAQVLGAFAPLAIRKPSEQT
jgi:polysaccharide biosynthesis protein PslE